MSSLETKQHSFQWLLRIRWISIVCVALFVLFIEGKYPSNPLSGVWAVLLTASVINLTMQVLNRSRRLVGFLILAGFLTDGLLVSWGVALTGGPLSSYIPFYMVIIMAACLVGSPRVALMTAVEQLGLFLLTLWVCYQNKLPSDFVSRNSSPFTSLLEKSDIATRQSVYLEQSARWIFFFTLTTIVCGLLIRQVWNREERLRVRERQLEQKRHLIQMGELTGRIAHGVNTPLGLISGNLELLMAETRKTSKTYKQLSLIEQYTQRAIHTVRGILDYSRQTLSEIKSVSLPKVIQAAVLSIQPRLKKSGGKLILDVDSKLPEIMAYPEGLFQVFLNLLENAVDSISATGLVTFSAHFQHRHLRLSAQDKRGEIKVVVRDTGRGIPAAELSQIFEPFYSTKGFGKGTGLGLAIVKRIVGEHRGEIKVESRVGEGTVFTLLFPTDAWRREEANNPGDFYYNESTSEKEDSDG